MYYIYLAKINHNTIKIGCTSIRLCQRVAVMRQQEDKGAQIVMGYRYNNITKPEALLLESVVRLALANAEYKSLRFDGRMDHFSNPRHITMKNLQEIMEQALEEYEERLGLEHYLKV